TGCYIGGHVDGGFGQTTLTNKTGIVAPVGTSISTDTSGFEGGGQIGCDYQFAPNWVVGAEGQFTWSDIKGSNSFAVPAATETINSKTDFLTSATARLGYSWDRWMIYAKGGA